MAEKRMINKSISVSEKVNIGLPDLFDKLLFTWMIPHSDDFGRLPGSPAKIKALVVPMIDVSIQQVEQAIKNMHNVGLIIWYEVDGEKYIQIKNFEEHQTGLHKRTKSKFPEPPNISGNFPEIPLEGKGTEQNRTEQKGIGTEQEGNLSAPLDIEQQKDMIQQWTKKYNVEVRGIGQLEDLFSFIGVVDKEVIQFALKESENKQAAYAVKILQRHVREGKTKKEDISLIPEGKVAQFKKINRVNIPIFTPTEKPKVTDNDMERIMKKAQKIKQGAANQ